MDTVFLRPVWLYLPDGSKERIIAQTDDNIGISFDSVHAGVEQRRYFRYANYSITQTEEGDYVVSPVDDECEKIYYPNGVYEYVSKVVPNDNVLRIAPKNDEYVEDDVHENVVSHPSHYAALDPEPITFIRDKDYLTGSALKYIFRAGHKNGADESIDMGKAAWYLRELVAEQGSQTVIAILRGVYWDTIDRQLAPARRAREVRDRLTEFGSAISYNRLGDYIPEEK